MQANRSIADIITHSLIIWILLFFNVVMGEVASGYEVIDSFKMSINFGALFLGLCVSIVLTFINHLKNQHNKLLFFSSTVLLLYTNFTMGHIVHYDGFQGFIENYINLDVFLIALLSSGFVTVIKYKIQDISYIAFLPSTDVSLFPHMTSYFLSTLFLLEVNVAMGLVVENARIINLLKTDVLIIGITAIFISLLIQWLVLINESSKKQS